MKRWTSLLVFSITCALVVGSLPYLISPEKAAKKIAEGIRAEQSLTGVFSPSIKNSDKLLEQSGLVMALRSVTSLPQATVTRSGWRNAKATWMLESETEGAIADSVMPLVFTFQGWKIDTISFLNQEIESAEKVSQEWLKFSEEGNYEAITAALTDGSLIQDVSKLVDYVRVLQRLQPSSDNTEWLNRLENNLQRLRVLEEQEQARVEAQKQVYAAINESQDLYTQGRYAETIEKLTFAERIATDTKQLGMIALHLAFAYRDYKEAPNHMQRAIAKARTATELLPEDASVWCILGDMQRQYGLPKEALKSFRLGLQRESDVETKASCWTYYGLALYQVGEYSLARNAWQTALKLNPNDPDAQRFFNGR